jgi:hypothetical protein
VQRAISRKPRRASSTNSCFSLERFRAERAFRNLKYKNALQFAEKREIVIYVLSVLFWDDPRWNCVGEIV